MNNDFETPRFRVFYTDTDEPTRSITFLTAAGMRMFCADRRGYAGTVRTVERVVCLCSDTAHAPH